MVIVINTRCSIEYSGRASSQANEAWRLIIMTSSPPLKRRSLFFLFIKKALSQNSQLIINMKTGLLNMCLYFRYIYELTIRNLLHISLYIIKRLKYHISLSYYAVNHKGNNPEVEIMVQQRLML